MSTLKSAIKSIISPSLRFEINRRKSLMLHFLGGLFFWKWQRMRFQMSETNATIIHYLGNPEHQPTLMALLGSKGLQPSANLASTEVFVSQFPMRDMICVPFSLTTVVKLNRTLVEIMATYASSLRRQLNKQRPQFRYEKIVDLDKIEVLQQEMLKPYAIARHDLSASQLDDSDVKRLCQHEYGRMDILYQNDEAVGCHIGNHYACKGARFWHVNRLGYPAIVFSDFKRWGEVNAMNLQLALETAIDNGFDYIDYGMSLAKPGCGLIEWKRRRKGFLVANTNYDYFYLKFPQKGAAQFFWDAPLFGVEKGQVTLHLGIPEGKTDEEVRARYHEMGYGGLYKVYLHYIAAAPSDALVESMRELYADQATQPMMISYQVK